jgi:hypothetical protein
MTYLGLEPLIHPLLSLEKTMTFEQHYGNCPPPGSGTAKRLWRDRRAVWIKAQLEMRERCAVEAQFNHSCKNESCDCCAEIARAILALEAE